MKRALCFLLVILLLVPAVAFAKDRDGITADEFMAWLTDCELKIPFLLSDYDDRTLFAGSDGSDGAVIGYTFKNSSILEAALAFGKDSLLSVYFLSAISDESDPQARVDKIGNISSTLESNILDLASVERTRRYSVKGYSVEFLYSESTSVTWFWISDSSKTKSKGAVLTDIGIENFNLVDAVYLYRSKNGERKIDQTNPDATTLSVGTYDCPTHIPAGEYKVTPQKSGNLFVYRDGALLVNEILSTDDGDEIGRLVLEEGDTIELASGAKLNFEPLS